MYLEYPSHYDPLLGSAYLSIATTRTIMAREQMEGRGTSLVKISVNNTYAAQTQPAKAFFRYKPLDLTSASVRFVRILPDLAEDGTIQCRMEHAILPARSGSKRRPRTPRTHDTDLLYSCLSYTWGNGNKDKAILINGKLYLVHQNLRDFLSALRRRLAEDGGFAYPHATYDHRMHIPDPLSGLKQFVSIEITLWRRIIKSRVWVGYTPLLT